MEDRHFSYGSDDTGIYSATDDELSQQCLSPSPIDQYEKKLAKYLELTKETLRKIDPFDKSVINYNDLMQVLEQSAHRSGLAIAAQLLITSLEVLMRQVEVYASSIKTLASDNLQKKSEKLKTQRKNKSVPSTDDADSGLEDSGIDSQSQHGNRSLIYTHSKNISRIKKSGTLLAENQKHITVNLDEVVPDVVCRRNMLHKKFRELADESSFCCIDIYKHYENDIFLEQYQGGSTDEVNHDASSFFGILIKHASSRQMSKILPFKNLAQEDGSDFTQEVETSTDEQYSTNLHIDESNNMEQDVDVECENIQPSVETNCLSKNLVGSMNDIPLENILECLTTVVNNESINDDIRNNPQEKQSLKRPALTSLEGINNVAGIFIEQLAPIESKRTRLEDAIENLSISEMLLERSESLAHEMGTPPEIPRSEADSLQAPDIEEAEVVTDGDILSTVPSLLYDEFDGCTTSTQPRLRPLPVNMKAVTGSFEKVIDCELQPTNKTEISFAELLCSSGLNIIPPNVQNWTDGSSPCSSNQPKVSIAVALLAVLDIAHRKKVHLRSVDNKTFNITRQRPEIVLSDSTLLPEQTKTGKETHKILSRMHED